MKNFLLLAVAAFLMTSCVSDERRLERELADIDAYIESTGLDFQPTGTGLYYHIEKEGNQNRIPDSTNLVKFKHIGYLLDSTIFSSGWYVSGDIPLPALVQGFQEGLQIVGEGGRAVIVFPSNLGYGEEGASTVPEYSPLAFKVELVSYY
ncbi:MAG: FKBP-type peptidyl-prolyl cis-trans isomerase [Schleiferiaceae bacterium]|jgi:FKBP-type peptidyl-prolyl cis-trans isomerase|nr:MAG: putative FKBP-type peptidyl-prolyl cis-trans isomerase FkpA [Cryomorphaceae bacterium]